MHSKLSIAFTLAFITASFAAPFCPNGAEPFEGTGRGATESKARENANLDIASLFSTIKVNILDELTQRETSNDIKEYANYQRKIKIESSLYAGYVKDSEYPYEKENGQFVAKRYLCPSDAAKPYLDSLKIINQRVSVQKINNSFCETLYKTYSPRVMLFERILERLREMDETRIADYRRIENECDDMRGNIQKGYVSFEEALDKAVAEISSKVRGKTKIKIAIAEIDAFPSKISDFITAELSSKLVKNGAFTVIGHNSVELAKAFGDKALSMSGQMKNAEAARIGKSLDAKVVITGSFIPSTEYNQLRIRAIDVQSIQILALHTEKIRPDDAELADLIPDNLVIAQEALTYLNKGEDFVRERKYDEAIRELDRALAIDGNLADGYRIRGNAYFDKGDYDRAIEDYVAALTINPNDYKTLYNRGGAYFNKGNYDRAIKSFTAALKIKPDIKEALSFQCLAYIHNIPDDSVGTGDDFDYDAYKRISQKNYDRAIESCNVALRIDPNYYIALNRRGYVYYYYGYYDRAIEDFNAALRIKPDYYDALYNRGNTYANKGNYDRAIKDFTAALRIEPDNDLLLLLRGREYKNKGDYDRAIKDFTAALEIKPDDYETLNNRGIMYLFKRNHDRAIEDFTAALRINPEILDLISKGWIYAKKGDYDRAIEIFTIALRFKPDDFFALSYRGEAYKNKGNYDKATKDFEALLRINPNNANAKDELSKIRALKR